MSSPVRTDTPGLTSGARQTIIRRIMPRFPITPATADAELEAFVDLLLGHPRFLDRVDHAHGKATLMASLEQLRTGLADLKTSVSDLVEHANAEANKPAGISEADLEPILAEITDLKTTVEAVLEANTAPAAPQPVPQPQPVGSL